MTRISYSGAGRVWTEEEDAILRGTLAQGGTRASVAKTLNRSVGSVDSRACKLGLAKNPRNYIGPMFKTSLGALRTAELGKPLDLGEGDYRYIQACLNAGGFASSTRVKGKIVFGHAGKAWVQP